MKVGDLVKSFDFVGEYSCYMLGLVTDISKKNKTVTCKFIARVFRCEPVWADGLEEFTAPLNGAFFMDRPGFDRIVVCK